MRHVTPKSFGLFGFKSILCTCTYTNIQRARVTPHTSSRHKSNNNASARDEGCFHGFIFFFYIIIVFYARASCTMGTTSRPEDLASASAPHTRVTCWPSSVANLKVRSPVALYRLFAFLVDRCPIRDCTARLVICRKTEVPIQQTIANNQIVRDSYEKALEI